MTDDTTAAPQGPPTTRRDGVIDVLHGNHVADPYRWLEAPPDDPELSAWVAAQAASANDHLATLPGRARFRARLGELWDHPRRGAPWRRGDRWFQIANDGTQEQDVLWTASAVQGADRAAVPPASGWTLLLDPSTWSEDATASLTGLSVSEDATRVAFARSDAGSDWMTWRVIDPATGEVLPDVVRWSKFSTAAWLADNSAFLYCAYEKPANDHTHAAVNDNQQLWLHRLGADQADDSLVHARPDQPEWGFWPLISHDGRWLVLTVTHGTRPTNRVHVAPIQAGAIGEVRPLLDAGDARYQPLGVLEEELVVVTDHDAPLGRVLAIGIDDPSRRREVVASSDDRLEDATLVGGHTDERPAWVVVRSLRHATSRLAVHDARSGRPLGESRLPGPGTVTGVRGARHDTTVHLTYETFTEPAAVLRIDLDGPDLDGPDLGLRPTVVSAPSAPAAAHLVVEQVHVHHGSVAVPLFLIRQRDVAPTGGTPTVLWGYGGFDIPVTPTYRPGWRAWVDAGGLLAVACLRGGGEYGRAWHDDGRLANKEHTFDDALACAAWLTGRRRDQVSATALTEGTDADAVWTAPRHLGIEGRSNGGLLAAACLTREPGAFGSVVPEVGVLDLLRFHRFTIGWAWTSDYGSPEDPSDFEVLLRYSPYHRLEPSGIYPPTLITTGDTDDRVVPAHSYKFAAALQHAQTGDAPILLRVDIAAGHGMGKPVSKLLDERADVLAFHAHHLGLAVGGTGEG